MHSQFLTRILKFKLLLNLKVPWFLKVPCTNYFQHCLSCKFIAIIKGKRHGGWAIQVIFSLPSQSHFLKNGLGEYMAKRKYVLLHCLNIDIMKAEDN